MDQLDEADIQLINEWPVGDSEGPAVETRDNDAMKSMTRVRGSDDRCSAQTMAVRSILSRNGRPNIGTRKANVMRIEGENSDQEEPMASAALARWWRRVGQKTAENEIKTESKNPNTLLSMIVRMGEANDFMRQEVRRLRSRIENRDAPPSIHAALGSYFEKLANLSIAEMHLQHAVEKAPTEKEYRWLLTRVQRQMKVRSAQEQFLSAIKSEEREMRKLQPSSQVEKISANELSFRDFFFKYALTSTPVVITDMVDKMATDTWTLQYINSKAGHCTATLKEFVPESVEWARLEDGVSKKVTDFIEAIESTETEEKHYLFDWSLPIHCPDLAKELTIPRYFAGDFLQRTSQSSLYQDSWPSLFIAPEGVHSDLHVDAFGSNFWMALFQGTKRWTFFKKEDTPLLYPRYEHSMDPVFEVDLTNPDLEAYPLLSKAKPMECLLQPGELLFVPAGCPHRVENLETSVAISANFVDLSNVELVKDELNVNSLVDPRAAHLLDQLSSDNFCCSMKSEMKDTPWTEFKSWPPEDLTEYDITAKTVKQWLAGNIS